MAQAGNFCHQSGPDAEFEGALAGAHYVSAYQACFRPANPALRYHGWIRLIRRYMPEFDHMDQVNAVHAMVAQGILAPSDGPATDVSAMLLGAYILLTMAIHTDKGEVIGKAMLYSRLERVPETGGECAGPTDLTSSPIEVL